MITPNNNSQAAAILPVIPEYITVHLGTPESDARNVTLPFSDYIKNVASSEIYPSWPEESLRANIYAQISYALNRVYTEYYRARGYDFDITNTTAYDQAFVNGREYFENVSIIVDEIFNEYIARRTSIAPLFAQYCNGTTSTCSGLSQWGTVSLAEDGLSAFEILTNYYGDDIEIRNADIENVSSSLPPIPLALGSLGNDVRILQVRLNRISSNYPEIPKIYPVDGIFDEGTENAVLKFQKIFNLDQDGIVGKNTWYSVLRIYNAVKRLNELIAEDLTYGEIDRQFTEELKPGDQSVAVDLVQYYLLFISDFDNFIPPPPLDGYFGPETEAAVKAFQTSYGLPVTGTVDNTTYEKLYDVYIADVNSLPDSAFRGLARPFPGIILRENSEDDEVILLQQYLSVVLPELGINIVFPQSGYFGPQTTEAVIAFQKHAGLEPNGIVSGLVWDRIAKEYDDIIVGAFRAPGQYPGYEIGKEDNN